MTTLTASQLMPRRSGTGDRLAPRLGPLRALLARLAAAAQADTARRATSGLSDHLLRDIGMTREDFDL